MAKERWTKRCLRWAVAVAKKWVPSFVPAGSASMGKRSGTQPIGSHRQKIPSLWAASIAVGALAATTCSTNRPIWFSARVDNLHPTVLSVFPESERRGLFPVGRLDKNTEGLLLLTDDGGFCHALMAPRRHVEKVYVALVSGRMDLSAPKQFAAGMTLADGTVCRPARLTVLGEEDGLTKIEVALKEGKHHQVKRMVAAVGGHVEHLKRISVGPLRAG